MYTPEQLNSQEYQPKSDYLRVATATPEVAVGDVATNITRILELYTDAVEQDVSLAVYPELSITGYTIQDLVQHPTLLNNAKAGLGELARFTADQPTAAVVGLPLKVGNALYNCAAVVSDGEIRGIVPKQNLPTYNEFYEKRWYQTWDDRENTTVNINGTQVPFGRQQLFQIGDQQLGIEICEDLWVPEQPSTGLVAAGATVIANPSASPETVAKASYRSGLVSHTAARNVTGYVYTSADASESTSEVVMSGHAMINELGTHLAERKPFEAGSRLMVADIDMQHIQQDRIKTTNFPNKPGFAVQETHVTPQQTTLIRSVEKWPFIPLGRDAEERLETVLNIQAAGLATKLRDAHINKVVLGLSGGLDSTLAFAVAARTAAMLGKQPGELIHTLTMPGEASSNRTQDNAKMLADAFNVPNEEIAIAQLSNDQLAALHHGGEQDVTYENTQARIRQALVFNKANQIGGIALGTGDLSEIALGWSTYNGDHMSHYNVNASIPKTLVRSLVRHAGKRFNPQSGYIIDDILDTPVSPELTGNGLEISQSTEELIGPYELHDFTLYHMLRWMEPKAKIGFLALKAFDGQYEKQEVDHWLDVFLTRFHQNQWKRQAMPDGAKVGISLSPKGDWRMPPDTKRIMEVLY